MNRGASDQSVVDIFDRYRGLLFSIAYRMLGTVVDAEDILQDASIRWIQSAVDEIHSPRAFLVTTVSRLCINHLNSARVQREEYVGNWLPEPIVTNREGDPAEAVMVDESISMAFLVMLERLTPIERAVFLLREVFDYRYSEIANTIGLSETNCRQILRRAKQRVGDERRKHEASEQEHSDLLSRFLLAARNGDIDALVSMLADDVVLHTDGGGKGAAAPNLIFGSQNVARGAAGTVKRLPENLELRLARINGRPGYVSYLDGRPYSVFTMDASDGRIQAIYVVTNPDKLARLPQLPAVSVQL